jgi:poly(3-hydroxybutyrate) depolymerase
MLYQGYQTLSDVSDPFRSAAMSILRWRDLIGPNLTGFPQNHIFAWLDVSAHARVTHKRPPFAIDAVTAEGRTYPVTEEVVLSLPFANLLHFKKEGVDTAQPKMLVVAPLSGHFATLLRSTVRTLLRDHDVYITDWFNARDVPLEAGAFGLDDYTDYIIKALEHLGPESHMLAVCQPCVPALSAVAIMAEDKNPAQPRSMTLMGGPVDTRVSPTKVNELAVSKPYSWFEEKLISVVPFPHKGQGRRVYPGFIQLSAFMAMNMPRHTKKHQELYDHIARGEMAEAAAIREFYDEYFAVLDMSAEFYLETIDKVFQRALLAKGELDYRGRIVKPAAIMKTALLTVEGERDDICAVGQTAAAHDLCSSLRPHLKRHHLQAGVGHYGLFAGSKWDTQIYPQVRNLVLAMS